MFATQRPLSGRLTGQESGIVIFDRTNPASLLDVRSCERVGLWSEEISSSMYAGYRGLSEEVVGASCSICFKFSRANS